MKAIRISVSGYIEVVEVNGLDELQAQVGGWIEGIHNDWFDAYINEEGKLLGLERNNVATALMDGYLFSGDYIAGPMLIVGPNDADGEEADVTAEVAARLGVTL